MSKLNAEIGLAHKQAPSGIVSNGEAAHDVPMEDPLSTGDTSIQGGFVQRSGESFYRITRYDGMAPFLMSIVSPGDLWMYVSSSGGLTAGRVSANNCLFPYETVDKLHHCQSYTGPLTLMRTYDTSGDMKLWHPFADGFIRNGTRQRNLYKHVVGDQVVFEEIDEKLGLSFCYSWRTSSRFGFVRTVTLENLSTHARELEIIDGLQNLQPYGIELSTYQKASCLTDAYKHNASDPATRIGIFSLTAQILDRAEAAEILKATSAWCTGLEDYDVLLSTDQLRQFCQEEPVHAEQSSLGRRGNYFINTAICLAPGERRTWHLVADVARTHGHFGDLCTMLADEAVTVETLEQSIEEDRHNLIRNVASADGLQQTGSRVASVHHFANVLFNNMRGGVFAANYEVETTDFARFVKRRNLYTHQDEQSFLAGLPATLGYGELLARIRKRNNRDLVRLGMEYLPLFFGRRHGDPSRPWNDFNIRVRDPDGSRAYHYEGNWRDIFQNWEALCLSFPDFLPSIIAKFVNASTVDGFNPYRVLQDGFEWEVPAPNDPWSNIGYWGDHQIVYLSKLLEAACDHFPGTLENQFEEEIYCYADVPYRIEPFDQLVENSRETIRFDDSRAEEIDRRVKAIGEDGKHVVAGGGAIHYVNLAEKLLVPALAKLSNLVLDGGIWMNTQRPEWNDANNALVGPGLSVVTACHLRRYFIVLSELLEGVDSDQLSISREVAQWLRSLGTLLDDNRPLLQRSPLSDTDRRRLLDQLGQAFCKYRSHVYESGLSGKRDVGIGEIRALIQNANEYLDHTIRANRRVDGLYHAYNLMQLSDHPRSASVSHLYEMLEGQVAVLSTGKIGPDETIEVVDRLFDSPLFRSDQDSFLLYPDRPLPSFLDRNIIPASSIHEVELLRQLVEEGDTSLVVRSVSGQYHFDSGIQRLRDLSERLLALSEHRRWSALVRQDSAAVADLFDDVFHHSQYTGRSGAMYGYEGLGSIYWHMIAKLLLAIQEVFFRAVDEDAAPETVQALGKAYYRVRSGLSSDKTPQEYGAFPTDPYSHTPKHSGAQQPGMTGQVKEEILTRRGEFGVRVRNGQIFFDPQLLRESEFLCEKVDFPYYDVEGQSQVLALRPATLAFTICQTPVTYQLVSTGNCIDITYYENGDTHSCRTCVDKKTSERIFGRTGEVSRIEVKIPSNFLFHE